MDFGVPSMLSIAATCLVMRFVFRHDLRKRIEQDVEDVPLSGDGKLVLGGLAAMVAVLLGRHRQ